MKSKGSANSVYVDECGFEPTSYQLYGYGLQGQRVHGERPSQKRPRTSVIAARRKEQWLAPMCFEGYAHSELVNTWFEQGLCKELRPNSTIILDNAAFHSTTKLNEMAKRLGHNILFLPPYSPDLNPIENDFAVLKKQNKMQNTTIDNLIKNYRYYPK